VADGAARKVAVVSGGSRGIGREIARQLAADHGALVVVGARREADVRAAADAIGHGARGHPLDVTDGASVAAFAAWVEREMGRVDILVNNAGVYIDRGARAGSVDLGQVQATLDVNVLGAWRLTQALLPLMMRPGAGGEGGRIVNLSSEMGSQRGLEGSRGGSPAYRLSKAAINALTIMLAAELAGSEVLVNAACPGWVRTDMGGAGAPRTVAEGADTPVWLATLPDGGPSGGLWADRKRIAW
jgi:NAD(P)-dependent dehydrogenase (short-subunit alcohol dehydrogenase family)